MKILGLSFDYHDAAAALLVDGTIVCAIQEERLSRLKHDSALPKRAIRACLDSAGLKASELDCVVHYEQPLVKFDRLLRTTLRTLPKSAAPFARVLGAWLQAGKLDPRRRIAELLDIPPGKILYCDHHLSHAASAFYGSPFSKATIVTLDGVGEYETATISLGNESGIRKIAATTFPHSLGLFYSGFTAYLGFEVNEGEYKVMGMAAFGRPSYYEKIRDIIGLENGRIVVDQNYFTFLRPEKMPFTEKLLRLLGPARTPGRTFTLGEAGEGTAEDRRFADIAASIQQRTEEIILDYIRHAIARTGIRDVAMAGGVALNSLANGRVQRELGVRLYIQPAAGDAGGAVGAALQHYHGTLRQPRSGPLTNVYLGLSYDAERTRRALKLYRMADAVELPDDAALTDAVAELLANGKVIGWMQGGFEWGPRALGNRSIIASPLDVRMRDRVNRLIKYREPFRPFAPAVLVERADEFFELPEDDNPVRPEHFMLSVCKVREAAKSRIPAVTHVDGTARVQIVKREMNPLYYDLIAAFGRRTGVPVILNTSFNLKGEPIVSTPEDAIKTFEWSGMDNLVIGRFVANRPTLPDLADPLAHRPRRLVPV